MNIQDKIMYIQDRIEIAENLYNQRAHDIPKEIAESADIESALRNALDEMQKRRRTIENGKMLIAELQDLLTDN